MQQCKGNKHHFEQIGVGSWIIEIDIVDPLIDLRESQTQSCHDATGSYQQHDISGRQISEYRHDEGKQYRLILDQRLRKDVARVIESGNKMMRDKTALVFGDIIPEITDLGRHQYINGIILIKAERIFCPVFCLFPDVISLSVHDISRTHQ